METKDFNYLSQKNIESFSFEFDIQLYDVEEYYYTTLYKVIFRIKSKCGEWNYQEDGDFEEYFKQTFFQLTHDEDTTSQYYYWSDKSSEFKPVIDSKYSFSSLLKILAIEPFLIRGVQNLRTAFDNKPPEIT